jgi:hypothetical protein
MTQARFFSMGIVSPTKQYMMFATSLTNHFNNIFVPAKAQVGKNVLLHTTGLSVVASLPSVPSRGPGSCVARGCRPQCGRWPRRGGNATAADGSAGG